MDVNEALQFTDRIVFEHTGNHLNDVQRAVVEGVWDRQTYDDIAKKCHITTNHVSDIGAELWKLLSRALEEDIKKSNFRSNLERLGIASSPIIIQSNNHQNNNHIFNFGTKNFKEVNTQHQDTSLNSKCSRHDLNLAPQITKFYDRKIELETISNSIFNHDIKLISVLGLHGIGKTTLVKRFVDLNLEKFEFVIWKSLKFPKSLESLIDDLLINFVQDISVNTSDKLNQLFTILTDKKLLVVLDDVQNIFVKGESNGQYQAEYQDYQNWFKMLTEIQHKSNLILISQEQCQEMRCLYEEFCSIKCLELSGLDSTEILENIGLNDKFIWLDLINLYRGNPLYINNIATLIKELFDDSVADFLAENQLVITNSMRSQFKQLLNRLSNSEKQLAIEITKIGNPTSREILKQSLDLSSTEFINALQSLQQRYLVIKIKKENKTLFDLSPIFKEYIKLVS
jgi:hypothetical protein